MVEMNNMKDWELELTRQEYQLKLVCWAVEGNGVVLVREESEEMLEGEDEPVMVTHAEHGEVWVTLTRRMERVDRVMNQLGEFDETLKTMNTVKWQQWPGTCQDCSQGLSPPHEKPGHTWPGQ